MKRLSWSEFAEKFSKDVQKDLADLRKTGKALVLFERQDMCSSHLGERSALVVGPGKTYETVEECKGRWLNDLPSQRRHAVAFTEDVPDEDTVRRH